MLNKQTVAQHNNCWAKKKTLWQVRNELQKPNTNKPAYVWYVGKYEMDYDYVSLYACVCVHLSMKHVIIHCRQTNTRNNSKNLIWKYFRWI